MPGNIPGIINIAVEEKVNKPADKKYCFGAYILVGDWRRQPKRKYLKTKSYSRWLFKIAYHKSGKVYKEPVVEEGGCYDIKYNN